MGIPYAKPPVGPLRFKNPKPIDKWTEVLDGTVERNSCIIFRQPDQGDEDCLYLNIFTPNSKNVKAVMVFIYGGGFIGGSSNTSGYAPDFLIDNDVVVATFNYRIGPLGFLSLQNDEAPGNMGLKDQSLALRWIKENIGFFGGDPDRFTVFGESSGAASVIYHLISPMSKGIINQVIAESGTPLTPWTYTEPEIALAKAFQLGQVLGCPHSHEQIQQLHQCLLNTPAPLLTRVQEMAIPVQELLLLRPIAFVPTSEPIEITHPFITKHPQEYLQSGEFDLVPSIMGINSAEGLMFARILELIDPVGVLSTILAQDLTLFLPPDLKTSNLSIYSKEIQEKLRRFYFREDPSSDTADILNIIGDVQFLLPFIKTIKLIESFNVPVFRYFFTFEGKYNYLKQFTSTMRYRGASHMDELGYILNIGPLSRIYNHTNRETEEERVLDIVTTLWTNFAKTGQPSHSWENGNGYLEIAELPIAREENYPAMDNVTLWNDIYEQVLDKKPFL